MPGETAHRELLPAPEKSTTKQQNNFSLENWEVEYDED